jgi:hypothetical protein
MILICKTIAYFFFLYRIRLAIKDIKGTRLEKEKFTNNCKKVTGKVLSFEIKRDLYNSRFGNSKIEVEYEVEGNKITSIGYYSLIKFNKGQVIDVYYNLDDIYDIRFSLDGGKMLNILDFICSLAFIFFVILIIYNIYELIMIIS